MSDTDNTETGDQTVTDTPDDATDETSAGTGDVDQGDTTEDEDTFPRQVVEDLRKENGRYRKRAQQADTYAQRLHDQMVRATGRLADPSDLEFNEDHLDDADALTAAIDDLLARKPHLASRKPVGDIGQGQRGPASGSFSLLDMLKERT